MSGDGLAESKILRKDLQRNRDVPLPKPGEKSVTS
jgi:hypothetical protein